jgi:hypothetical protein
MPKTLANFRTSLGSMIGFPEFTDLPDDEQAEIDTIINAAYLECYAERGGRLPKWIEQYWSDIAKAPAAATLGLTNGSKTVTGFVFEAKYAGSFVKIGDKYYRFGGVSGGDTPVYSLVQPWDGVTGNHAATIYYNSIVMPGTVIEVCEAPSLLGVGPLTPIPNPETELALRAPPSFDFVPRAGRAPFAYSRPRFNPGVFVDVGDPIHYHIDEASTGVAFATASKFMLYPIPGAVATVDARVCIVPTPLEGESAVPVFPNATVDVAGSIMMPIAFDLLLKHPLGRRYSGNNAQLIMRNAEDKREQLRTVFSRVQRRGRQSIGVAEGW